MCIVDAVIESSALAEHCKCLSSYAHVLNWCGVFAYKSSQVNVSKRWVLYFSNKLHKGRLGNYFGRCVVLENANQLSSVRDSPFNY